MKTNKIRIYILASLPLMLSLLLQLFYANNTVGTGQQMIQTEKKIQDLSQDNRILREQIAQNSSLFTLSQTSESLGLKKPESLLYLDTNTMIGDASVHSGY